MNRIEGFLCPECMGEFASVTELQQHWTKIHQEIDDNVEINENERVGVIVLYK